MKRFARIFLVTALAAMLLTSTVQAGGFGCYGGGFPWFGYGNNGPAAYALGNIPTPPYFALHPPVYYSHPMAYPYGRSPFAYPVNTPIVGQAAVSRVWVNPYVEQKPTSEPAKSDKSVAVVPQRIANPYFQSPGLVSAK